MYEVIVLKEGYSIKEGPGQQRACGTITLLKGPSNVIVDTGNPWDKDLILEGLSKHGCSPEKIQFVVCTHGHSDHVGNLNLFPEAIHIVSHDICVGDQYMLHSFKQGIPYEINEDIEVIATPGHTATDVSVLVRNTSNGIVAVTGDLFECSEDLEDYSLWQENSEQPELQQQSRIDILRIADWIVPGHGQMFKVPEEYKRQMKVVMYYEYSSTKDGEGASESGVMEEYLVCEEDD